MAAEPAPAAASGSRLDEVLARAQRLHEEIQRSRPFTSLEESWLPLAMPPSPELPSPELELILAADPLHGGRGAAVPAAPAAVQPSAAAAAPEPAAPALRAAGVSAAVAEALAAVRSGPPAAAARGERKPLSQSDIAALRAGFERSDCDRRGVISLDETLRELATDSHFARAMGYTAHVRLEDGASDPFIALFQQADADQDDILTWEELLALAAALHGAAAAGPAAAAVATTGPPLLETTADRTAAAAAPPPAPPPAAPPPPASPAATPRAAGLGEVSSLRISVGAAQLLRRPQQLRQFSLRYAVPACAAGAPARGRAEDIVIASCREVARGGTLLVFNHASTHPMRLTAKTLPELTGQPLRLTLMAEGGRSGAVVELGAAEVPWHEALLAESRTYRAEVELRPQGGAGQRRQSVGKLQMTVTLQTPADGQPPAATGGEVNSTVASAPSAPSRESSLGRHSQLKLPQAPTDGRCRGVHLRMALGRARLRTSSPGGLQAVLKLGPAQEVFAQAVSEGQVPCAGAPELEVFFSMAAVSAEAVWLVDATSGECVDGPRPPRLFIQLWQSSELFGLTRMQLPTLGLQEVQDICAGGCIKIISQDIQVQSAGTGALLGALHVTLHAGMASALSHQSAALSQQLPQVHLPVVPADAGMTTSRHSPSATGTPRLAPGDAVDGLTWYKAAVAATLRLALVRAHVEGALLKECGGTPRGQFGEVSVPRLQALLLKHVEGISTLEAALAAAAAADAAQPDAEPLSPARSWPLLLHDARAVPLQFLTKFFQGMWARIEACVDSLVAKLGSACDIVVRDLLSLGPSECLRCTELGDLLRARGAGSQFDALLEALFLALSRDGVGWAGPFDDFGIRAVEAPAGLLARLLEGRAAPRPELTARLPPRTSASMRLMLPLSRKAVEAGFAQQFAVHIAKALAISSDRVQGVSAEVDSPVVDFEVVPGQHDELSPDEALTELAAQLTEPRSPLRTGNLGSYLINASLHRGCSRSGVLQSEDAGPLPYPAMPPAARRLLTYFVQQVQGGKIRPNDAVAVLDVAAQDVSTRRPDLWCTPDPLTPLQLARLGEADADGADLAVKAWEKLRIRALPVPAASALWLIAWPAAAARVVEAWGPVPKGQQLPAPSPPLRVSLAAVRSMARAHSIVVAESVSSTQDLQARLFEVVREAGVEPERAFKVLDRNHDGLASLEDFAAVLRELGLPFNDAELALAAKAAVRGDRVDVAEFAEQYKSWVAGKSHGEARIPPESSDAKTAVPETPSWQILPVVQCGFRCLELPSYVLFALIDIEQKGRVPIAIMQSFAERCLGLSAEGAKKAAKMCDLGGSGSVAYRDFRQYLARADREQAPRLSSPERCALAATRGELRQALELAAAAGGERRAAEELVAAALRRRGESLESPAGAEGLAALLRGLRLPARAAAPLLEWRAAARPAAAEGAPSYREVLGSLRHARELLRSHTDGLYSVCMAASVDLKAALDFALRRPDRALEPGELGEVLRAEGAKLGEVDLEDALQALDPYSLGKFFAPELIQGYAAFKARYGSLMSKLAGCLGSRGLSPDEFFARTAKATAVH